MNANQRKMRRAVLLVTLSCLAATLAAMDLTVEYVQGFLDVRDEAEWIELYVGDTVLDNAVIRLDTHSIAELSGPGIKLTLTRQGIYQISELIAQRGTQRSVGLASVVGNKVAGLFAERNIDSQAAVMGVRGSQSQSTVQWMTGDTAELIKSGKERLEKEELSEAFGLFGEAYDFAERDEETEVLFYLGYTAYLMEDLRNAAYYLGEIIDVEVDVEFFPDLLLLNAQVLTETFAFQEALDWIGTYGSAENLDDSVRQTAFLLEGVNYRALGDLDGARRAFARSQAIDPESDIAELASAMQSEL